MKEETMSKGLGKTKPILSLAVLLAALSGCASAPPRLKESAYRNFFAATVNGSIEVRTDDGAVADIVDGQFAWEVDFEEKWAEGVGQALFYAEKFKRSPGVVLVAKGPLHDKVRMQRLMLLARKYGIKVSLLATRDGVIFPVDGGYSP